MSKAFTSDEAPAWEPPPRVPSSERAITPDGLQRLEEALQNMMQQQRPQLLARAAQADSAAVAALRQLERRAYVLQRTLALSRPLPPPAAPTGRVFFGAYVTVEDGRGSRLTYRLVGPDQSHAAERWFNHEAPLGRALLGQALGATVTVHRPRGEVTYKIVDISVSPQPEAQPRK